MTRIGPVMGPGKLNSQAVNWLVRSEGPGCTSEERAQLEAWLASPRHRAAYLRMRAAWSQADQLRRLQPLDGRVDPDLLRAGAAPVLGCKGDERGAVSRAPKLGYILVALALSALVSALTAWFVVH